MNLQISIPIPHQVHQGLTSTGNFAVQLTNASYYREQAAGRDVMGALHGLAGGSGGSGDCLR